MAAGRSIRAAYMAVVKMVAERMELATVADWIQSDLTLLGYL